MLFNSYIFIFVFLPLTLVGYFVLGRLKKTKAALTWLTLASFVFYGWWNPAYLVLIGLSIGFNYSFGRWLTRHAGKRVLTLGVIANLSLLGYYKYANFFVDSLNKALGLDLKLAAIVLPLGISFFTFTQIAYLVDAYRGEAREYSFLQYCIFVTFFPHLIAGPILHHREIMPQFETARVYRFNFKHFAVGVSIFLIGLFKKVVLADAVAKFATPLFDAAAGGRLLTQLEALTAALAYSFQLYFDFSGYSDMAIGLSLLFGIRLPLNFYSPYKASSIIDMWRRWHITLSRFLMQYLYIPLGGNRKGRARKYLNLTITFLLAGVWHGAGFTYIAWGALQSFYLVVNNLWRDFKRERGFELPLPAWLRLLLAGGLTYACWVTALVVFRAPDFTTAASILAAIAGAGAEQATGLINVGRAWRLFAPLAVIVWGLPNVMQVFGEFAPAIDTYRGDTQPPRWLSWRPSPAWACALGLIGLIAVLYCNQPSEFLYFQF